MKNMIVSEFEKTPSNEMTHNFTITNANGASVVLSDFGATIRSIRVPDKDGKPRDVVLAYEHIADCTNNDTFFGQTIGRCCNRICDGAFSLNGKKYQLNQNNGKNHLHGGNIGFGIKLWDYEVFDQQVVFTLESPDGEESYPGTLKVQTTYTFDDSNTLTIEYCAVSDQDTICNLTNHSYFNLNGHESGSVADQYIQVNGEAFLPTDETLIPTGEYRSVKGTPLDFTSPKKIGDALSEKYEPIIFAKGVDHCFVLDEGREVNALAYSKESGIKMTCATTQKGIHVYTANYVDVPAEKGKEGVAYSENSAFCFEAQNFPDAINHDNFPSVVLKAGETYHQTIKFSFSLI